MNPASIELLILDVDGVLTDGRLAMADTGEPAKTFYVRDGVAIKNWQRCGGKIAILSGRSEASVARRAVELGIELVLTGAEDKRTGYDAILAATGCRDVTAGYVGDDLPDLAPMGRCGFPVAVRNAAPAVKQAAMYVTRHRGGEGAVAEVIELLLRKRGQWPRETC